MLKFLIGRKIERINCGNLNWRKHLRIFKLDNTKRVQTNT